MLRTEKTLKTGEVLTDMSQFSIESGRLSIEKQYENLLKEREILSKRKLELEHELCLNYDKRSAIRRTPLQQEGRNRIIAEIKEIEDRLQQIKPIMTKVHDQKDPLLEVIEVLKDIRTLLQKR